MSISQRTQEICADHALMEGPLLPILHTVQAEFGYLPQESLAPIATALRISNAELHGVIEFYHDFHRAPQAKHVIRVCRAEACQAMGGASMISALEAALGMRLGETKNDVALEAVYCLGLCACAPAAQVNGELIGRATVDRLVSEARS
jgi:formate dehydrogenase subunit gamma